MAAAIAERTKPLFDGRSGQGYRDVRPEHRRARRTHREITAIVVNEEALDGSRPGSLELFECGPALQELSRNIGTDFIEPGEHLRWTPQVVYRFSAY